LHEGNAATDLYLDPNVEKTFVVVRIMPLIRPKRLIITHMGDDMLARRGAIAHETAEDGLIVKI